jgi:hypothetical protein
MTTTPRHCPGFEEHKDLKSFMCKCSNCGASNEIFSDEFDKPRKCASCKEPMTFSECSIEAGASQP